MQKATRERQQHRDDLLRRIAIPHSQSRGPLLTRMYLAEFHARQREAKAHLKSQQLGQLLAEPLPDSARTSEKLTLEWLANQLAKISQIAPDETALLLIPNRNAQIPMRMGNLEAIATHLLVSLNSMSGISKN